MNEKKYLTIIGSTGSIGQQTLDIIKNNYHSICIFSLICKKNYKKLMEQCSYFRPKFAVLIEEPEKNLRIKLEKKFSLIGTTVLFGEKNAFYVMKDKIEFIFLACYGFDGAKYAIEATKSCNFLCIANKESIICIGSLIFNLARKNNVKIIPIDSEHNTIFQIIEAFTFDVKSITITASGGFVRDFDISSMQNLSFEQVIKHPSWKMGEEISINSSTMMNKVMEIIEAYYLFKTNNIEAIIHNESIVHAIVNFEDGFSIAGISNPNMQIHIQNALDWPNKNKNNFAKTIDLAKISKLSFSKINKKKYPLINLAYEFLKTPTHCFAIAMNAANEVSLNLFKNKAIKYNEIANLIIKTVNLMPLVEIKSLDIALEIDKLSREKTKKIFQKSL